MLKEFLENKYCLLDSYCGKVDSRFYKTDLQKPSHNLEITHGFVSHGGLLYELI